MWWTTSNGLWCCDYENIISIFGRINRVVTTIFQSQFITPSLLSILLLLLASLPFIGKIWSHSRSLTILRRTIIRHTHHNRLLFIIYMGYGEKSQKKHLNNTHRLIDKEFSLYQSFIAYLHDSWNRRIDVAFNHSILQGWQEQKMRPQVSQTVETIEEYPAPN